MYRSHLCSVLVAGGLTALPVCVALAADPPAYPIKTPPAVDSGELRIFLEGGGSWTAGDPVQAFFPVIGNAGFNDSQGLFALRPRIGWDMAAGFDYRFGGTPWHVSTQLRYGAARSSAASPLVTLNLPDAFGPGSNVAGSQSSTATDRESHWLADFAFGHDVNVGPNPFQVKAGLRVAELTSRLVTTTNGSVALSGIPAGFIGLPITSLSEFNNLTNNQNTSFRGAGPRIGVEGAVPLGGAWQFDYLADAALLFGTRRLDNPVTSVLSTSPLIGLTSTTTATANQHGATVPNLDAQVGLSYWLNPNLKMTASYRVEAYFGALSTFDQNGDQTLVNRIFHGPRLTLTGVFSPDPRVAEVASGSPLAFLKAPPVLPKGEFTAFVEGGAFRTGGDPVYTFYPSALANPGYFAFKPSVGWDAGGGFDYRFAGTPWHISAAFNDGEAKMSGNAVSGISAPALFLGPAVAENASQSVTSSHRETHWTADLAVGHDLALGRDTIQAKAGMRIAELTARTGTLDSAIISFSSPTPFLLSGGSVTSATILNTVDNAQASRFRGAGPRIGVEGSLPLRGGFTLDFLSDVAVLFGSQSFQRVVTTSTAPSTTPAIGFGGPTTTVSVTNLSQSAAVANADMQAGISYWVNPSFKLSASYRLDAFFGALTTLDANANQTKVDRYLHGPRVAATVKF